MSPFQLRAGTKVVKRILTQRRFLMSEAGFMSGETHDERTEVRILRKRRCILTHLPLKYQRSRLMGPRQSLLLLVTIMQSGMNRIGIKPAKLALLRDLTGSCGWSGDVVPSVGAMCKALRKLTPDMRQSAIHLGISELNRTAGPCWLVHRRRLVAIDGVRINARRGSLLARWLGLPKQGDRRTAHQPQALVVIARCVASGVTLDQEIVKHNGSERQATRLSLGRIAQMRPLLVVMDRGIPARDIIALLIEKKIDFIVRMSGGQTAWKELVPHTSGPAKDSPVTLKLRNH